ncbi:MAG: NAD-glutamate dehydrogenase [Gaiellales bacterium]
MASQPSSASASPGTDPGVAVAQSLLARFDGAADGPLGEFARAYARRVTSGPLDEPGIDALAAQVAGLFEFISERRPGDIHARAFNPDGARDGWSCRGSVLEANVDDMPFLIDSVTEELRRRGLAVRNVMHPVIGVERDGNGRLAAVVPARGALHRESVMHFEVDRRMPEAELEQLTSDVIRVIGDVALSVRDFHAMADSVGRMIEFAQVASARYSRDEIAETVAFLEWLTHDNFVFLGYREYAIDGDDDDALVSVVPDSGLGVLSDESGSTFSMPKRIGELAPNLRERVLGGPLLIVSKTNRESTVHRRVRMDHIGVKRVGPDGSIVGELRMIGLFTSKAYAEPARHIPLVRRKLESIMEQEDLFPGSHDHKAVVAIFESFPKDELFAASEEYLRTTVMGLMAMEEQRQISLFLRNDYQGHSVSAVVALPRDHVSTELRTRLAALLEERFGGDSVEYHLTYGETEPARFHFVVHVPGEIPNVSRAELETEVLEAARSWDDRLADALSKEHGETEGQALARRYGALFPDYYKSATPLYMAKFDVAEFEKLGPDRAYVIALQNERDSVENLTRLKLYKTGGKAELGELLPMLEDLGLRIVEEVPTRLQEHEGEGRYLHDFGVYGPDGSQLDLATLGPLVADAVGAVWDGRAESDSLNRLVPVAALSWREVSILRAYRQYRQVLGGGFTKRYQNDAFVRNGTVAKHLMELFALRLDFSREPDDAGAAELEAAMVADLDAIASLDDDRILRSFLGMILATVRTNVFKGAGELPYFSFKLRCEDVPGIPKPVPRWEIFVYSPEMEGVHLRGGFVARGGIRWSDRLEDYRTEILGLMKAQMVKNAVIVPTGAKGGFVLKQPPADRGELMEEERRQYITLMRGMLDLTDNIAAGEVVRPAEVRVLDTDTDAYLVVAADKGTAHLSDTANEVSIEYGHWLGDAYASGGSAGYDHKALGITAKGAWESVKRHFREMGRDVMTEPFTVVGIGDMSGDVFGNGMLLSPVTRVVAAFDHRHVFIDPSPDAASSFAERQRLFALAGSSWDDYDRSLISEGGGVWPRTAKSVPLSPQAREALGVSAESMSPTELCHAVLRAPVDLFWNGGIGTFVKAESETNADVGDRANDALRVNGGELRARVVGEGGNLGFTQRGRIEYAMAGGRINTDAIDNSAGVDCSDHEVNLKILLSLPMGAGELAMDDRNALLQSVAGDVTKHVLYDNYLQVQILSQEQAVSHLRMEHYEDLMTELEASGMLDRELESLPSSEVMAERQRNGRGLVRPELCVLLAYAKRLLREQVTASTLPDDGYLHSDLAAYFPAAVIERFGAYVATHPLRREMIATIVTNDVINSMGITFVPRMAAETGASPDEVARAFIAAREVSVARARWDDIEGLDGVVPGDVQAGMMTGVDTMVEQLARWYLQHVPDLAIGAEVASTGPAFAELVANLETAATGTWRSAHEERLADLRADGVPERPARFAAMVPDLVYAPDIIAVSRESGRTIGDVAHAFFVVGERLYLDAIQDRVAGLPAETRWQRLAWASQLDDLRLLRRQIVFRVILQSEGAEIDPAVDAYLAARVDPYQRLARLIESTAGATDDASVVMVMVHQIRQVVS